MFYGRSGTEGIFYEGLDIFRGFKGVNSTTGHVSGGKWQGGNRVREFLRVIGTARYVLGEMARREYLKDRLDSLVDRFKGI